MSASTHIEWAIRFPDGDLDSTGLTEGEARYELQQMRQTARFIPDPALRALYADAQVVRRLVTTLRSDWEPA